MIPFNSTVDVIRVTKVSDGLGGWTDTEVIVHNDLACRINWSKGAEKIIFDKTTYYRDAKVYCKVFDILVTDKIVYDSKSYEVVSVSNPDNLNWYCVLDVKLIE